MCATNIININTPSPLSLFLSLDSQWCFFSFSCLGKNMRKILKNVDGINLVVCIQWAGCLAGWLQLYSHTFEHTLVYDNKKKNGIWKLFQNQGGKNISSILAHWLNTTLQKFQRHYGNARISFSAISCPNIEHTTNKLRYIINLSSTYINYYRIASHRIVAHELKRDARRKKYRKSAKLCNDERSEKKNTRRNGCVSVTCHKYIFVSHFLCVCTLFHPILFARNGKLNFIHESLRHISWRFFSSSTSSFASPSSVH